MAATVGMMLLAGATSRVRLATQILLAALRRLMKVTPINTVAPRRRIADETVARGGYVFGM